MLSPGLLITLASLCRGAVLVSEEDGKQIQLQEAAAFGYEILEHRLDNLQNTFFKLFTSMEKVEQTRLEGQRAMLEQIQKGITVQTVNRGAHRIIEDCMQADVSGRYLLRPVGSSKTFAVVCEAESLGGGWIVIQQRINGTVEFNRNWEDYKNGFGSVGQFNEFWLGLERMHQLTTSDSYELAVELRNESSHYGYALFSNFKVAGENDNYRLFSGFRYSEGIIGNTIQISFNEQFSANDKDYDKETDIHCGSKYKGGWWFFDCDRANLNGPYKKDPQTGRGIYWKNWADAATYSRIMIRRC
ncbi:fibrinogen-like protein 1 isoform X1 [Culex pipiens pallens]|uniref:fibrinogen-like protein 1 isoform X1 n=1 Tax=Culex pipiens pallens TaxID=42434 RepID=UPI001952CAC3|nr:fibrinogen-like protein 1 isoform X1 [Culex pipiens pallens]